MFTLLIIILALIAVCALIVFGRKLVSYKATKQGAQEENIFEELKNLQSLKITVVPTKELYGYFFGNMLLFIGLYIGVCIAGGLIEHNGIIQPLAEGGLFFIFYILMFVFGFWQYAFFVKAIIPNLKHGVIIHKKLQKLMRLNAVFIALPVWISAAFGFMTPGFFAGMFLVMFVSAIIIHFEIQRAGIPNFYEGLMNLRNKSKGA